MDRGTSLRIPTHTCLRPSRLERAEPRYRNVATGVELHRDDAMTRLGGKDGVNYFHGFGLGEVSLARQLLRKFLFRHATLLWNEKNGGYDIIDLIMNASSGARKALPHLFGAEIRDVLQDWVWKSII